MEYPTDAELSAVLAAHLLGWQGVRWYSVDLIT